MLDGPSFVLFFYLITKKVAKTKTTTCTNGIGDASVQNVTSEVGPKHERDRIPLLLLLCVLRKIRTVLEKVLQIPKDDPNRWQSETENPWLYHCFDEFTTTTIPCRIENHNNQMFGRCVEIARGRKNLG